MTSSTRSTVPDSVPDDADAVCDLLRPGELAVLQFTKRIAVTAFLGVTVFVAPFYITFLVFGVLPDVIGGILAIYAVFVGAVTLVSIPINALKISQDRRHLPRFIHLNHDGIQFVWNRSESDVPESVPKSAAIWYQSKSSADRLGHWLPSAPALAVEVPGYRFTIARGDSDRIDALKSHLTDLGYRHLPPIRRSVCALVAAIAWLATVAAMSATGYLVSLVRGNPSLFVVFIAGGGFCGLLMTLYASILRFGPAAPRLNPLRNALSWFAVTAGFLIINSRELLVPLIIASIVALLAGLLSYDIRRRRRHHYDLDVV